MLEDEHADECRIQAPQGRQFIDAHERCFVVEQNRDGQLRSLLAIETGVARDSMASILDYGGMPLTADRVVKGVMGGSHPDASTASGGPARLSRPSHRPVGTT